MFRTALITIVR